MSKPKPISHSSLAHWLANTTIDNRPVPPSFVRDILRLTSGGVIEEGGKLPVIDNGTSQFPPEAFQKAATLVESSGFVLGAKSMRELEGVHPQLVKVVKRAIALTTQDFMVYDGLRTPAEQARLKAAGASKTLDSYHIKQDDGFGHAVDLVPFIGGVPKWDWDGCYKVALAMDQAATEQGVADMITWGGAWDRNLADFGGNANAYRQEVEAYASRHPGKDFLDGPHFQWRR